MFHDIWIALFHHMQFAPLKNNACVLTECSRSALHLPLSFDGVGEAEYPRLGIVVVNTLRASRWIESGLTKSFESP